MPSISTVINRPLAGIVGNASPASPPAATNVVASTATDPVTNGAPAVAVGATYGVHAPVPRSISVSDIHRVVTPEDSMKSRNGGLIRPRCTNATTHHVIASATHSSHHAVKRRHTALGRWQTNHTIAHRHPVSVATALTAPISAIAKPERAASTRTRGSPDSAMITGSSTHGASIIGSVSDEIAPSVVSTRGDSANATAPTTRDVRAADAECFGHPQHAPEPDGQQQRPPQPLRHPAGDAEQVTGQEEGAVREEVAVRLVLRLAERQVAVPQTERAGQEAQRVGGEIELRIG